MEMIGKKPIDSYLIKWYSDCNVIEILKDIMSQVRQKPLTAKNLELPKPPKAMTASEIIALRKKKLKVSQAIFASLLNVTPGAVQAWEQGVNEPNGATLRLLQITRKQPEILIQYLT